MADDYFSQLEKTLGENQLSDSKTQDLQEEESIENSANKETAEEQQELKQIPLSPMRQRGGAELNPSTSSVVPIPIVKQERIPQAPTQQSAHNENVKNLSVSLLISLLGCYTIKQKDRDNAHPLVCFHRGAIVLLPFVIITSCVFGTIARVAWIAISFSVLRSNKTVCEKICDSHKEGEESLSYGERQSLERKIKTAFCAIIALAITSPHIIAVLANILLRAI